MAIRYLLLALHTATIVGVWWILRPSLAEDWPAMLAGALIAAYPMVVGLIWTKLRGKRLGQV